MTFTNRYFATLNTSIASVIDELYFRNPISREHRPYGQALITKFNSGKRTYKQCISFLMLPLDSLILFGGSSNQNLIARQEELIPSIKLKPNRHAWIYVGNTDLIHAFSRTYIAWKNIISDIYFK